MFSTGGKYLHNDKWRRYFERFESLIFVSICHIARHHSIWNYRWPIRDKHILLLIYTTWSLFAKLCFKQLDHITGQICMLWRRAGHIIDHAIDQLVTVWAFNTDQL